MSNDSNSAYSGACRKDIPYPSVSNESVPSLIDNLVTALYGEITKSVVNRRVQWNIPCDPSTTPATILGIPREDGEGLLCYIIRVFNQNLILNGQFSGTFEGNLIGGQAGSLVWQSAPNVTSFLPAGLDGQILVSNGSTIEWVNKEAQLIAGDIAGGSAGQVVWQSGVDDTSFTATGTIGQVLLSGGTGTPTWFNQANILVNLAYGLKNGAKGSIPYQTAVDTTAMLAIGAQGQVLSVGANQTLVWTTGVSVTSATNLNNGAAGQIPYQTAANTTSFSAVGSANQTLHSNGAGAPTWSKIVNLDVDDSAGIVDTKLATISTTGKVLNSATTATSANTASAIVARDASGNFSANQITTISGINVGGDANITGNVTGNAAITINNNSIVNALIFG